jgi:hypothetical protein
MSLGFADTIREAVALFASRDRSFARFGARRHRYAFRAPVDPAAIGDVRIPDDYREHITTLGDGGAGPYHGLLPFDHPVQRGLARDGAIGLGHLGCGYMAMLALDTGVVSIDVRGAGAGVIAAYPSFRHYMTDWIQRLAHNDWLEAFVPAGACALPHALSAYFRSIEDERGMPEGTLAGDELRDALDALPDGGIATTHDGATPFFAAGDRVDLCVACERLMDNLGLRRDVIQPGVPPIPGRE